MASNHAPIAHERTAQLLAHSAVLMHALTPVLSVTLLFTAFVLTTSTDLTLVLQAIHQMIAIAMDMTMFCDKGMIMKLPKLGHPSPHH
jgi:hypothetical protein